MGTALFGLLVVAVGILSASIPAVASADAGLGTWTTVAPLSTPREGLAAVTGPDGRIYAIGGTNGVSLATVDAYDPATNTWSQVAPLPTPRSGLAAAVGPDGRLYAIGATPTMVSVTYTNEAYTPPCRFVLGFRTLHARIPDTVGSCLDDEQYNPANGDTLQRTTHGLLVWRKADNFTAFTDGYRTWVNGPYGV